MDDASVKVPLECMLVSLSSLELEDADDEDTVRISIGVVPLIECAEWT